MFEFFLTCNIEIYIYIYLLVLSSIKTAILVSLLVSCSGAIFHQTPNIIRMQYFALRSRFDSPPLKVVTLVSNASTTFARVTPRCSQCYCIETMVNIAVPIYFLVNLLE